MLNRKRTFSWLYQKGETKEIIFDTPLKQFSKVEENLKQSKIVRLTFCDLHRYNTHNKNFGSSLYKTS